MASAQPQGRPRTDQLARSLGWASLALGVPQITTPGHFARAIGVRPDAESRAWTLAVGVRELVAAAGILVVGRPRPVPFLWSRVAGDIMDLTLLVRARQTRADRKARLGAAIGAVIGIGVADVVAAVRMTRDPWRTTGPVKPAAAAITVWRPRERVEALWGELHPSHVESVRFTSTPDHRGTEIHAGTHGLARMQVEEDLRRLKQLAETGIVVRSEGSPEGPSVRNLLHQRPARPLAASAS
jgi:hypothetical protein